MNSDNSNHWHRMVRKVMICNPFLILSPLFLLYGIYQAVTNPNLFSTDLGNTLFHFGALLGYVTLLGVISTQLAHKAAAADAALLLCLHALLYLAPFILIAHAVFLQSGVALSFGVSGFFAAMGQLLHLKRKLPRTFVTPVLLVGAMLVLAAGVALPMIFRHGLENPSNDNEVWGRLSPYAWQLLLPSLVLWINLLPRSVRREELWTRPWFAPAVFLTWVTGIGLQLWTLAYVDDRHLRGNELILPMWVLLWSSFRRTDLLPEQLIRGVRISVPGGSLIVLALAAWTGLPEPVTCALFAVNALILACARLDGRIRWISLLASTAGCCLVFPRAWWLAIVDWIGQPIRWVMDMMEATPSGVVPIAFAFGLLILGRWHATRRVQVIRFQEPRADS